MPIGTEVVFGPGHIVLHRDSAPPPKKGAQSPSRNLWPMSVVAKAGIKMPLGTEVGLGPSHINLGPSHIVLDGDPAPHEKGTAVPQFSAHVYCGQTVAFLSYC